MTSELTGNPAAFRQETTAVLSQLRSRLIDLLDTVPGNVRKSRDVQKYFGLDAKLSWQIFRIVNGGDPLELTQHIPTSTPMRKLLEAARKKGSPPTLVHAVTEAFEDYERYIEIHAGDRKVFDSMLSDLTDNNVAAQIDLQHRKGTFECHRHYWGLQVRTQVWAMLVHPGTDPRSEVDLAVVRSVLGLERLRPGVPAVLDHLESFDLRESADSSTFGVLDPEAAALYGVPILPRFSSSPLPPMTLDQLPNGVKKVTLAGDKVGRLASSHVSFGHVLRGLKSAPREGSPFRRLSPVCAFILPTQLFVIDVLFHRPSFQKVGEKLSLFGHANSSLRSNDYERNNTRLPCRERVVFLGSGSSALRTPEAPQYVEMLRFTCGRLNWNLDDFDVYRTSVQYPMLDTALVSQYQWECRNNL